MIFIVNHENRMHFEHELEEMHRQRRETFIERLAWTLPASGELEFDEYDGGETLYLLALQSAGEPLLASARLLPTTRPYLMQGPLAYTCSAPLPAGPAVWEASRFCPSPAVSHRRERLRLLWEVLCGITETALLHGIDQIIFTANSRLLPLTLKCGWETTLLGPTLIDGCDEVTAVSARMSPEGLRRLRCRTGISAPVTRFIAAPRRRAA